MGVLFFAPPFENIFSFLYITRTCCQRVIALFSKEIDKLAQHLYIAYQHLGGKNFRRHHFDIERDSE
jgi:hypothetical protein